MKPTMNIRSPQPESDVEEVLKNFFEQQVNDLKDIQSQFEEAISKDKSPEQLRLSTLHAQARMTANLVSVNLVLGGALNTLKTLRAKLIGLLNTWLNTFWLALSNLLNSLSVHAGALSEWSIDLTWSIPGSVKIGFKFVPPQQQATTSAHP